VAQILWNSVCCCLYSWQRATIENQRFYCKSRSNWNDLHKTSKQRQAISA